jgi:hypothetical protein
MMSNGSRFNYKHGIKRENIRGKRMVCTFRELADEIMAEDPEICKEIMKIAGNLI